MKFKIIIFLSIVLVLIAGVMAVMEREVNNFENEVKKMKNKDTYSIKIKSSIEHKELKQNGYSIHYFTSGKKSRELVVFLHPAFADHRSFDKQIDYFSSDYRVVTIDMLGHGLSESSDAKDKIDFSIEHIDEIIKLEGYKKAHFVGVSMGTLIAQYYALKNPEKILSMTVLGGYDINADNKEVAKEQRFENIKMILKAMISMDSFRKHIASVTVSLPDEQARFYEMSRLFTRKSFLVMSGMDNVVKQRENIKREHPLLILCGEKDIELARRISMEWHKSDPGSKYYIIKNAGHCANMDNAEEFNRIVMGFIKQKIKIY